MTTNLTAKQEAFCREIVSGMSQADAYRQAYAATGMMDATIHKRCKRGFKALWRNRAGMSRIG